MDELILGNTGFQVLDDLVHRTNQLHGIFLRISSVQGRTLAQDILCMKWCVT